MAEYGAEYLEQMAKEGGPAGDDFAAGMPWPSRSWKRDAYTFGQAGYRRGEGFAQAASSSSRTRSWTA
jgi:hypothetical protein